VFGVGQRNDHPLHDFIDGHIGLLDGLVVTGHHLEKVAGLIGQILPDPRGLFGIARPDGNHTLEDLLGLIDQQQKRPVEPQPLARGHADQNRFEDLV